METESSNQRGIFWLSSERQSPPVAPIFDVLPSHFHVTLQFGVYRSEIPIDLLGQRVRVRVTENCFNSRIQAVRVQLPEEARSLCRNEHPHMTVSMVPGVRPVESNGMLLQHYPSTLPANFELDLIYEFSPF